MLEDSRIFAANAAAARLFGVDYEFELVGQEWPALVSSRDQSEIQALLSRPQPGEHKTLATDGQMMTPTGPRLVNIHAWTGQMDARRLLFLRIMPEEATPVESRLAQLDRGARLLDGCLKAVHACADEQALLAAVCRICVEEAGYRLAWAGFAAETPGKPILPVAHAGLEAAHFSDLRCCWDSEDPHSRGPSGTAVLTGRPALITGLPDNPDYQPWRAAAERCGYTRSLALPLALGEGPPGVLTLCDSREQSFAGNELPLLEQLAATLAFGIRSHRLQAQRRADAEELRAAKEFLAGLLDNAPLPISASNTDGYLLMVNKAWRKLFECDDIGQARDHLADYIDPAYIARIVEANREVGATGKAITVEATAQIRKGRRRLVNTRFPLRDAEGRITAIGGILEDITERHRAHNALRESEQNLREAEQVANLGHWVLDVPTQAAQWSDNMYKVFGVDRSNPRATTVAYFSEVLVHPGDRERVLQVLGDSLQSGSKYDVRYRVRTPQGDLRHIHAKGLVTKTANGQPLKMVGTCQDISFQVEAEEKLAQLNEELVQINEELRITNEELMSANAAMQESEARYKSVMDLSPDGIVVITDGRISLVNEATLQLFGVADEAELLGKPLLQLVPEVDQKAIRSELSNLSEARPLTPLIEARGQRRNGKPLDLEIRFALMSWKHQNVLQATLRDVTQRKSLEQQVRQSQKMEAIGTLASGIAHDFNNLLFGILGYADLLRDALGGNPQALEDLEELRQAGLRAKDLVQQILVVSRRAEQRRAPLQVGMVVREALKLLRATLPATVHIIQQVEDAELLVLADPGEIHQVVMNLCTNAAQAMPLGGRLSVSTRRFSVDEDFALAHVGLTAGPHLLLQVSDNGEGMSPEVLERIFEPFFTTKGPGTGTGLGLSVVYGIVSSTGGAVNAYSQPGQGTTFNVYLPLDSSALAPQAEPLPDASGLGGSERILVVDDDPSLMKLLSRSLGKLGYSVTAFSDSSAALSAFRANPDGFDLLITDYTMPGLTGMHLANAVRALRPRLPIILTTGFVHEGLEEAATFAGIRELVTKPVVTSNLAAIVRRLLDERQA